jgi:hypothetical protein
MPVTQQEETYQGANVGHLQGRELHISNNFWNLRDSIFTMHISFLVLRQQGIKGYTRRKDQNLILLGDVARFRTM